MRITEQQLRRMVKSLMSEMTGPAGTIQTLEPEECAEKLLPHMPERTRREANTLVLPTMHRITFVPSWALPAGVATPDADTEVLFKDGSEPFHSIPMLSAYIAANPQGAAQNIKDELNAKIRDF